MRHATVVLCALGSLLLACGASDDDTGGDPVTGDPGVPGTPGTGDPGTGLPGTEPPGTEPPGTEPPGTEPPPTATPGLEPPPPPEGCNIDSGYAGDEVCILPPAAGEGIQLHVGPADYDDPDAMAPFLVMPGEENVRCFSGPVSESGFHYIRQQNRMRPGSHHMLIDVAPAGGGCNQTARVAAVPGSQTPVRDFPNDAFGPEDAGIARFLPGTAEEVGFQLHYVNTSDQVALREAWVNLYKMPEAEVAQTLQGIFLVGDLAVNVPAHTRQTTTLSFTPALTESTRIYNISAHSHAHTETFTVWRVRGAQRDLIYQSFDWAEPDELTYNTVTTNTPPDPVTQDDGGHSGLLYMEPGDSLEWACDVNNTTNASLRFANEAYTAEMCLLPGSYISDTAGLMSGTCFAGRCGGRFGF